MKWFNASKDILPADGQIVLISVNGVNIKAEFSARSKGFITAQNVIYPIADNAIYWARLPEPEY